MTDTLGSRRGRADAVRGDRPRRGVTGLGSGLLAIALVITFRTTRVLNFALGGIATVCAFTMSTLWGAGDWPLFLALVVVVAMGGVLGAAGERVLRPVANAGVVVKAVAALGLAARRPGRRRARLGAG